MNSTNNIKIVLFQPRIPQNTGNIARTVAAFNYSLELIEPLGFSLEDKYLKRAGLDYWPYVEINVHKNFELYLSSIGNSRIISFSKYSNKPLYNTKIKQNDILVFGREDTGLPDYIKEQSNHVLNIPMPGSADLTGNNGVRSLNLSVACGIVAYKAYVDILGI